MAADVIKSIKASGGDYSSIAAWEAGQQGNLVTADERRIGELYAETYVAGWTINGSTTDSTRYMWLRNNSAAIRLRTDALRYGIGKAPIVTSNSEITIDDNYFRFSGFDIQITTSGYAILFNGDYVRAEKCIAKHSDSGEWRIFVLTGVGNIARNCLCHSQYDTSRLFSGVDDSKFFNCTAYSLAVSDSVFYLDPSGATIKNCASFGSSGSAAYGTGSLTTSASHDTTGTPAGLRSLTASNQFKNVSSGSEDFRLKGGSALIGAGTTLDSTDMPDQDDIYSTARPLGATWEVGCHEYDIDTLRHRIENY